MSPTLDRRSAIVSLAGIGAAGFATSRSAFAQSTPAAGTTAADGAAIVVTVTGSASAPATHAIGQIIIRAQYNPTPPDDPTADSGVAGPEVRAEDVQAVVGALIAQGIDQAQILTNINSAGIGGGMFGPGTAVVVFQLDGEQIKTLPDAYEAVTSVVTERGLAIDQPGAMLLADTCQDLRGEAFRDAVAQGMDEATLMADALGVGLGELRLARKQSVSFGPAAYGYTSSDACEDLVDLGTAVRSFLPAWDATLPNEFTVYAMVELTFASE
jgi:uncharacterized protein YggE